MSSGGAATNSGIDFQHRIGAMAMLSMVSDLVDLQWLRCGADDEVIRELRFETNDGIDDLVIVTDGPRILIQAKRSLSLSTSETSEFASVVGQFVDQFVQDAEGDDRYVLAISPAASRRIKEDLRKVTEAARLNELGATQNPLTGPEDHVLQTTYTLIEQGFAQLQGRDITLAERDAIFGRIHVAVVDIEGGGSLERAALTLLASQSLTRPEAVWGSLIALGLALAKDRLSIDKAGLEERIGRFLAPRADRKADVAREDAVTVVVAEQLSAGREIVLASDEGNRLVLAELIRFADDGSRRVRFIDGDIEMQNGIRWKVLHRTSTFSGMERILEADPSIAEGNEVVLFPINSDEDPDASPWAQSHAAMCREQMEARVDVLECLRCGRPISEALPPAVEVDEEGLPHDVGLIHTDCLRPTYRVIGRVSIDAFAEYSLPPDFDHQTWLETRPTGQGAFNGVSPALQGQLLQIGWKPGRVKVGNWCVTYTLDDGSVRYVHERGRVSRLTKRDAEDDAGLMNEQLAAAEAANDPFCVSERSGSFSTYSRLLQSEPGGSVLEVVSAQARELTRATVIAHDEVENFYAPLLSLIDADRGVPFTLENARVLLTDPLRLRDSVANWEKTGLKVPSLATTVIASDDQFDSFVVSAFRAGEIVVVDPMLNPSGQPLTGYVIVDLEAVLGKARAEEGG